MSAINHAAAALAIKRKFPTVSFIWLLISAQPVEFIWVAFNYLGVERTTTENTVRLVGDMWRDHGVPRPNRVPFFDLQQRQPKAGQSCS